MPTLQYTETSSSPVPVPHKKQLLNHIIDGFANVRPEQAWAKIPRHMQDYSQGSRKVTYRMFANAINGTAWWLVDKLGKSEKFRTLAYFGVWDPRYIILLLGAVKAGYKMVFPSLGYGIIGLKSLLARLECNTILTASDDAAIVSALKKSASYTFFTIPSLHELLENNFEHYPYSKTFESARHEPLVVVHTSGTTGIPKPFIYTHDWAASWIQQNQRLPPEGHTSIELLLHGIEGSGLFPNLFGAVANEMVADFPLPMASLTLDTALSMIRQNDPDLLIAPPQILDALAEDEAALKEVSKKVSLIGFGGGPLSRATGDRLSQRFRLFSIYGTSEMGIIHKITPSRNWDQGAWNSVKVHPLDNIEFRPLATRSQHHEAVIIRNNEFEDEQPIFKVFPDLYEWSTKDIFQPDVARPGFMIYQGRLDDLIILSDGSTVNPVGYEQRISQHAMAAAAIMYGTGRPHVALLIELKQPQLIAESGRDALVERIWSAVEECNEIFPPQAKVSKESIVFANPDKPLPRAGKGTVQRIPAFEMFAKELNDLYPRP
ncbi:MAG: hypothetical protein M1821_005719 [Bathelium mastoideum]|nr:MAG: hypothetical protein M1821_005719 [Bathelium mastoideum]